MKRNPVQEKTFFFSCFHSLPLLFEKGYHAFPGGAGGKGPASQGRKSKRHKFDPWVGKMPWRKAWQPTPVFLPRESPWTEEPGCTACGVTKRWT